VITSNPSIDVKSQVYLALWNELGLLSTLVMEISWMLPWYLANISGPGWMNTTSMLIVFVAFAVLVVYTSRLIRTNTGDPFLYHGAELGLLFLFLLWLLSSTIYQGSNLGISELISQTIRSFGGGEGRTQSSLILIAAVVYVWWRGVSLSGVAQLDFFTTRRKLRLGVAFLGIFGVVHGVENNRILIQTIPYFFLSGLLAISLSRTYRLSQRQAAFKLPFSGRWFGGIVLVTIITLLGGAVAMYLLRTDPAAHLAELFGGLLIRGIQVLILIISPLFLWVIPAVERLVQALGYQMDLTPEVSDPDTEINEPLIDVSAEGYVLNQEAIIAIILLLLILVIILILRRSIVKRREMLMDFGDPGDRISGSQNPFRRIADRIRDGMESIRDFGFGRQLIGATVIRRTYSQLLALANEIGKPREIYETPSEFERRLYAVFPYHLQEISLITKVYNQVRYGEFPEEEHIVSSVRAAWLSLRKDVVGKTNKQ
jgi:hypothetical protein